MKNVVLLSSLLLCTFAFAINHRIEFKQGEELTLRLSNVGVKVVKIKKEYSKRENKNIEKEVTDEIQQCRVALQLNGRDYDNDGEGIGDHYFGSMDFQCEKGRRHKSFKMHFSKVYALGLDRCYLSSNLTGDNYCNLSIVAIKQIQDENFDQGVYFYKNHSVDSYYKIHNENSKNQALSVIKRLNGNPLFYHASQNFKLSFNNLESYVYMPDDRSNNTSFTRGDTLRWNTLGDVRSRDAFYIQNLNETFDSLNDVLAEIEENSKDPELYNLYFQYYKQIPTNLLSILDPVSFYNAYSKIKEIDAELASFLNNSEKPAIFNLSRDYFKLQDQPRERYFDFNNYYLYPNIPSFMKEHFRAYVEQRQEEALPFGIVLVTKKDIYTTYNLRDEFHNNSSGIAFSIFIHDKKLKGQILIPKGSKLKLNGESKRFSFSNTADIVINGENGLEIDMVLHGYYTSSLLNNLDVYFDVYIPKEKEFNSSNNY